MPDRNPTQAIYFMFRSDFPLLKGTGLPDKFLIFWPKFTDLGLNKGRGWFLNMGLLRFYIKIKVFLPDNAQLGWLDNVCVVPQVHFIAYYWSAGLGTFLPIGWKILQTVRQRERLITNVAPPTRRRNCSNYTLNLWLIIDKVTPLTLSSQPNSALNVRNIWILFKQRRST